MNEVNKIIRIIGRGGIICFFFFLISCNNIGNHLQMANDNEYYTCSMDPQVIENKEGICPICHMELIMVKKNNMKVGQIQLSKQQIKLANITYDTLREHIMAKEITLTGKVTVDQNLTEAISARVYGRIEKLFVKNIGDYITQGQLLYEIYSEDLNNTQQEYLISLQSHSLGKLIGTASKNKLLLYGMSESQINKIRISKEVLQIVPVFASKGGFVSDIYIVEGNYVNLGTNLFQLASLNSLWVEAQVYLPYLQYIEQGTEADFSIESTSEKLFNGKVIFIDPQVQSPERYVLARFEVTNPSQQILPGMLANISLQTEKKTTLALPIDAIIQDSKGANVWVRNSDGIFENKMVKLGRQNSQMVEIISGITAGEVIVVTGAYLLNSEYVFKRGANPMEGMKI